MTLREYISFWQETYDKHQSRPTTYAAHNYVFKNHILPGLGDIPLSELTSEMVGEFLEERKRFGNHRRSGFGLGEETMRHIHRLLQQCLDQTIRDGLLTENPAKAFRYRKSTTVKANIMTPLEMEDYLDAAERLGYLPMFMLALTTGLRQGELIALKWSDLDIESRTLTIAENRAVVRRELVECGRQTRSIRLPPEVVDLLTMEHSKHPSSPLMFMHPATLKPYSPQMVRRMHNEIIKEAGIDHIRFTDLRHTCAILALKNGMDTKELAQMLGHYRPTITRQNYEPYLQHKVQKDEDILCEFEYIPLPYILTDEERAKKKKIIAAFNAKKEAGEPVDEKDMLEKFMFRHKSVCNLGHQKLSELYMQEAVKIRRDPENYRLTGLRTTLKEYIETECTDAVFKVGLSNLKYRTNGGNKPLRYLFSTLNEHIEWYRNGAVGAPAPQKGTVINYDNVTIEHIASQSPSAAVPGFTSENIHTLSNLTLLTNGENDRAKNKSYTAKKAIYHDSEYVINKYFDSVDDWSVESAKAWEQYLQEMVCKVFVV